LALFQTFDVEIEGDSLMREEEITKILYGLRINDEIVIKKPSKDEKDFQYFKFDLIAKSTSTHQPKALIEAKYRSNTDRPTTDSVIASLIKLLYEWAKTYRKMPELKLILLIYVKEGLSIPNETFRNNVVSKLNELWSHCLKETKEFPSKVFHIVSVELPQKLNSDLEKQKLQEGFRQKIIEVLDA